jgi:hypothetical protein
MSTEPGLLRDLAAGARAGPRVLLHVARAHNISLTSVAGVLLFFVPIALPRYAARRAGMTFFYSLGINGLRDDEPPPEPHWMRVLHGDSDDEDDGIFAASMPRRGALVADADVMPQQRLLHAPFGADAGGTLRIGDVVRLSAGYYAHGDAAEGPLRFCDVGLVVGSGPAVVPLRAASSSAAGAGARYPPNALRYATPHTMPSGSFAVGDLVRALAPGAPGAFTRDEARLHGWLEGGALSACAHSACAVGVVVAAAPSVVTVSRMTPCMDTLPYVYAPEALQAAREHAPGRVDAGAPPPLPRGVDGGFVRLTAADAASRADANAALMANGDALDAEQLRGRHELGVVTWQGAAGPRARCRARVLGRVATRSYDADELERASPPPRTLPPGTRVVLRPGYAGPLPRRGGGGGGGSDEDDDVQEPRPRLSADEVGIVAAAQLGAHSTKVRVTGHEGHPLVPARCAGAGHAAAAAGG